MFNVFTDQIPSLLKERPRWVLWKGVPREGKISKVPKSARTGRNASSTDPATWATFEQAVQALRRFDVDGLGFVLADDDLVGLDIDACVDPLTEQPDAAAQQILARLATYSEISPSGRGIRAIAQRADGFRLWANKRGRFEAYTKGRFLTITGRVIPGYATVRECTDALREVCVKQLGPPPQQENTSTPEGGDDVDVEDRLRLARAARNGKRFVQLYDKGSLDGHLHPDGSPDHSAADLALCSDLAFWLGKNPTLIDQAFRKSRLMRGKWDEARGTETYGERTVRVAIESCEETFKERSAGEDDEGDDKKRPTQSEILIRLADAASLFRSPDDRPFASFDVAGHTETWAIRSKGFRSWLLHRFYEATGKGPSSQAMTDALGTIEARCRFEGAAQDVHIRMAEHDGAVYLDLCDAAWRVVEVTPDGWRIVTDPPVRFRRPPGMRPLPEPVSGGDLGKLRGLLNLPGEEAFVLAAAWLLKALYPSGPFPILCLEGEQGSGKSLAARLLRGLVDPATTPLRTLPREERDLMIAANNGWVAGFDNLSGCPPWLSDGLCRLATGGGFATRELYSDQDEVIFSATRPVLLNGIDRIATRNDFADRAIVITLPAIPEDIRKTEAEILAEYQQYAPGILGALLDAVALGLARHGTIKLDRMPRMADFALWATACEPGLGLNDGDFLRVYDGNRSQAVEAALESDPVAVTLLGFMGAHAEWTGSPTELLAALAGLATEGDRRARHWPKTAPALGKRLRRLSTFLRAVGLEVDLEGRVGRESRREYTIRKVAGFPVCTICSDGNAANSGGYPADSNCRQEAAAFCTDGLLSASTADAGDPATAQNQSASARPEIDFSPPADSADSADSNFSALSGALI